MTRRLGSVFRGRQRAIRELSTLNEVSRAIIRADLDVDELCELVYREASKVLDTSWFHLALFDQQHYLLKVRVQNGQRLPPVDFDLSDQEGLMGWMRRTGRALLIEDFTEELPHLPAQPRYHSDNPPRSGVYVPLLAGDSVIGTISVQSPRPRTFDADDLRFLSLIADGAASAIAKARAYATLRERLAQLELLSEVGRRVTAILDLDQLFPSVVTLIRDTFEYYHVHLFVLDGAAGELIFRASTAANSSFWLKHYRRLRIGEGIVGYVAQTREPLIVNDVEQDPRFIRDVLGTKSELAVPLSVGEELLAVLDVQSDRPDAFTDSDLFVLQTLADQLATALDLANTYAEQQEEAWTLAALLQTAENIARASSLDDLLATIVRLAPLLVGCDRCAVLRYVSERDAFVPVAEWGWDADACDALLHVPLPAHDAPLLHEVRRDQVPVAVNDASERPWVLPRVVEHCGSGRLLLLPMVARGALLGAILLDRDPEGETWEPRSITIAVGIANQAGGAMESALLAQAAVDQERLAQEVRVAREIQTSLLPSSAPVIAGWEFAMAWRSARAVGGDFYDFWRLAATPTGQRFDEARDTNTAVDAPLGFVVADVSDKGVPAALFMALARSLMRAAALDGSSPVVATERANRWITRDSQSGMFVTLFYGVLDVTTGDLRYTNAGHNPPLLLRSDGRIEMLSTPGIALGVIEDAPLNEKATTLDCGDLLICYTDGVTEAINEAEEEYGVARLTDVVIRNRHLPAQAIIDTILGDLLEHTGRLPAFDDVTLVLLKRVPSPQSGH
ncbi:MAG TPA: SpoIIE family protein phosphatase [Herpetosiphonaceae bacterium]|nr:SpoIIE family protein phosphatase [Herpetosiphonaceae bacterium]